jgi:hypothetical protein
LIGAFVLVRSRVLRPRHTAMVANQMTSLSLMRALIGWCGCSRP